MARTKSTDDIAAMERLLGHLNAPAAHALREAPDLETLVRIMSICVDLRPGGRAILRIPSERFRVEVLWRQDGKKLVIGEVRVVGEGRNLGGGVLPGINFGEYLSALEVTFWSINPEDGTSFLRNIPRRRPKPGQAPDTDFYRRVLAARNELIAAGHPAPAAELAERYGENPATVRGWIHRARKLENKKEELNGLG